MRNIKLDSKQARRRGELGLAQAVATAERNDPDWAEKAYAYFKKWLSRKPSGYRFQVESFRLHVQISGAIPAPTSDRAYGGIPTRAKNEKLIRACRPQPTTSVTAHGCFSMEWQKI